MRVSREAGAQVAGPVTCSAWERWKPAARARTHALAAAVLWTLVGLGLAAAGIVWTAGGLGVWGWGSGLAAVAVGVAKARMALEPTARKALARIRARGDGRCLGGFLSWRSWMFVVAMMALGAVLRRSPVPRGLLGFVYLAVGTGLLWASREFWAGARRL